MRLDKKSLSVELRLVLWRGVGSAFVARGVDEAAVRGLLAERGAIRDARLSPPNL